MKKWLGTASALGVLALCGAPTASFAQGNLQATIGEIHDYEVSPAATALTLVYDTRDLHSTLSISTACSSGTGTLKVESSADDTNWLTIDSVSASASSTKVYGFTTAGASTAVAPLSYRWLRLTVGSCGSSNTSTTYVGIK